MRNKDIDAASKRLIYAFLDISEKCSLIQKNDVRIKQCYEVISCLDKKHDSLDTEDYLFFACGLISELNRMIIETENEK